MNIGHSTTPDRCPRCLRSKQEAIADHLRSRDVCDCPDCPFSEEIRIALIEQDKNPNFCFGTVRKPTFSFSKHNEPKIKAIFRRIGQAIDKIT